MAIYKRGNTYWFELEFAGQRIRKSAQTRNRRAAEQIEAAYRVQLAKGEVGLHQPKKAPLLSVAVKEFLVWSEHEHAAHPATHRRYATSTKALLKFFGDTPLDRITPDDVEKFKQWRSKQKKTAPACKLKKQPKAKTASVVKPSTVNRDLACLKILFNYFIKGDVLNITNPVSRVKFLAENNENFVVLTLEEERLYLMAASQPLQDVARLMLETGCRPEEICKLRKEDVNLANGFLLVSDGKTKAARRRIPLTAKAKAVLTSRLVDALGEYLFAGGRGGKDAAKPIVKLNNAHNGARKRAFLRPFRLYDLRHTYASRMAMAGVDLVTLAALLGHSRVQMVLRYAHPVEEHKVQAVKKLEAFLSAAS